MSKRTKGINGNQLNFVLQGLEHKLKDAADKVEPIREDLVNVEDTTDLRNLLKELKDVLRFVKRCTKDFETFLDDELLEEDEKEEAEEEDYGTEEEDEDDDDPWCAECSHEHSTDVNCDGLLIDDDDQDSKSCVSPDSCGCSKDDEEE